MRFIEQIIIRLYVKSFLINFVCFFISFLICIISVLIQLILYSTRTYMDPVVLVTTLDNLFSKNVNKVSAMYSYVSIRCTCLLVYQSINLKGWLDIYTTHTRM